MSNRRSIKHRRPPADHGGMNTDDEQIAGLDAYWNELEFATWRIHGAFDPECPIPEGLECPPEVDDHFEWSATIESREFSDALAAIDWDAEAAPLLDRIAE